MEKLRAVDFYCMHCGGYLWTRTMFSATDRNDNYSHARWEDCVRHLSAQLKEALDALHKVLQEGARGGRPVRRMRKQP